MRLVRLNLCKPAIAATDPETRPMRCLFYVSGETPAKDLCQHWDVKYQVVIWRPSLRSIAPPHCPKMTSGVWWLFHICHVFRNRGYCALLVFEGKTLVHRLTVFPGYFRFPFMGQADLQIGDTYTHPAYRGRGIATVALGEIVRRISATGGELWYVTSEDNVASIRVAEKAGFRLRGYGTRRSRFGMRLLGQFRIDHVLPTSMHEPHQAVDVSLHTE